MNTRRILIAGIGNIFLGDDGFGVEVVQHLLRRSWPDGVRVADYGIRGYDLAFALLDHCDAAILVDALPRGEKPGTLFVVEPILDDIDVSTSPELALQSHGMDPVKVLLLARTMSDHLPPVTIVGCEPATIEPDEDGRMGLSEPVQAAVPAAIDLIESIVGRLLTESAASSVSIEVVAQARDTSDHEAPRLH